MSNINYVFIIYRIIAACTLLFFMVNLLKIIFVDMVPFFLYNHTEEQESVIIKDDSF